MFTKKIIPILFMLLLTTTGKLFADDFPCLEDVTISTQSGETTLLACQGDIVDGFVKFKTSSQAMPFAYVVVDESGTILLLSLGSNLDLTPFQNGSYRIYAFSFLGSLQAEIGDNIFTDELASFCYELTVNYVSLNTGAPDAGTIATEGPTLVCVGDENPDVITFTNSTAGQDAYVYLVTDANNIITAISEDGSFDFNDFTEGTYFVSGLSYIGNLTATIGMDINSGTLADGCSTTSDSFIAITASNPDGGIVMLEDGGNSYDVCDGSNDVVLNFEHTTTSQSSYDLVLVAQNNIVLSVIDNHQLPVSEVPLGTSYVTGVSYTGNSNLAPGLDILSQLSDDCYDLSGNVVTLFREEYSGGAVSLEDGATEITICVANGEPDLLNFVSTGISGGDSFTFVITDDQSNILGFSEDGSHDFDEAPQGTCLIYGLTYDGNLLVGEGDNLLTNELADGCFGLSSNFITIYREAVNGGTISFSNNGSDYLEFCSSDEGTEVFFNSDGAVGDNFRYLITDEFGNITGIHPVTTSITPPVLLSYTRYIYWLAFSGDDYTADEIAALVGQNLENAVLREGCYDLSDNRAELRVSYVDGGSVELEGGSTSTIVCSNDSANGLLTFANNTDATENQIYLLTDANNNIITFIDGNTVNFTVAALGDYRVWSVSYTGEIIAEINDPADEVALSDGCFDLSDNFVEIFKTDVEGGTISTLEGDTFLMLCPDGNAPESINFTNMDAVGNGYGYVLTDDSGVIVAALDGNTFEFSSLPVAGILHFYGVAYTGVFDAPFGENIDIAALSDECYDLSDNFVEIIYENAQAGTLTVNEGQTELSICVGDGIPDVINFEVVDATHLNYAYVVTNDEDFIIGVIFDDSFDFDNAIGGPARIYGLSYSGTLNLFPGDNINDFPASDDCYQYSEDFVLLNKNKVDGGLVFADDFTENTIYVCAGDEEPDIITFGNSSDADEANYQYVLTTEDNLIISFLDGDEQDFEDTGFTTLRIWGVSYTGNFSSPFGSFIDQAVFSDECYTLSENYVTIIRGLPEGGEVTTIDGETTALACVGTSSGVIEMATTSTATVGYVWLLLDENGIILEVFNDNNVDFNLVDPGLYRVWGLSYTGELLAMPGLLATQVDLASSCHELSDNFVEVVRAEDVDGGSISVLGSEETTIYTCPGDDMGDLVILETTSLDPDYRYIITDTNNMVIIPQIIGPAIDFDSADPGEVRIYGVSFNGNNLIGFGTDILEDALSDNCYTTSSNYITVIIGEPVGGTITSDQGDEVTISVGDEVSDVLTFSNEGASETHYVYVITDDEENILGFVDGDSHDFEGAAPGICHVWGVAYTGDIEIVEGENLFEVLFNSDCYSISDNFVTVIRTDGSEGISTGGNQNAFMNLSTYPNPATQYFTASFKMSSQASQNAELLIYDLNGQVIYRQAVSTVPGQNEIPVMVSDMMPGLYFLQLRNENEQQSTRFSKQ